MCSIDILISSVSWQIGCPRSRCLFQVKRGTVTLKVTEWPLRLGFPFAHKISRYVISLFKIESNRLQTYYLEIGANILKPLIGF